MLLRITREDDERGTITLTLEGRLAQDLVHLLEQECSSVQGSCGSLTLDGIAFNVDRDIWPNPNVRWVELVYKLDVNEYQGRESVQLMVAHLAPR